MYIVISVAWVAIIVPNVQYYCLANVIIILYMNLSIIRDRFPRGGKHCTNIIIIIISCDDVVVDDASGHTEYHARFWTLRAIRDYYYYHHRRTRGRDIREPEAGGGCGSVGYYYYYIGHCV